MPMSPYCHFLKSECPHHFDFDIWKIKTNKSYKFYIFCKQVSRSGSESESDESEDDFDGTRFKVESQLNVKRFLKVKY